MGCPEKRAKLKLFSLKCFLFLQKVSCDVYKLLYIFNYTIFELCISVLQNFIIHSFIHSASSSTVLLIKLPQCAQLNLALIVYLCCQY